MTTSQLKSQGPSAGGPGDQLGHLHIWHRALGQVASLEVCTLSCCIRQKRRQAYRSRGSTRCAAGLWGCGRNAGDSESRCWADVLEKGKGDRPSIPYVPVVSSTVQTLMPPAYWIQGSGEP